MQTQELISQWLSELNSQWPSELLFDFFEQLEENGCIIYRNMYIQYVMKLLRIVSSFVQKKNCCIRIIEQSALAMEGELHALTDI